MMRGKVRDVGQADLLTTAEAACYLRVSFRLLEQRRSKREGPPFIKQGKRVFYKRSDLDAYLDQCRVEVEVPR